MWDTGIGWQVATQLAPVPTRYGTARAVTFSNPRINVTPLWNPLLQLICAAIPKFTFVNSKFFSRHSAQDGIEGQEQVLTKWAAGAPESTHSVATAAYERVMTWTSSHELNSADSTSPERIPGPRL